MSQPVRGVMLNPMAGFSIHDVIRTEEQFRSMQEYMRRMGDGDKRLCRITFEEFKATRSVADVLAERLAGGPPKN